MSAKAQRVSGDRRMGSILVVEDKASMREMLMVALEAAGYRMFEAPDGARALEMLKDTQVDLVVSDLKMPRMDGMQLLKATRELASPPAFIMITAHGSIPDAVQAMNLGAADFIEKPFELEELEYKVAHAIGAHAAPGEASLEGVIGASPAWLEAVGVVARVTDSSLPLLLVGESGSGRRWLARRLHEEGSRAQAPFVELDCSAGPDVERNLFGWERSASANAKASKPEEHPGALEQAQGGTLYLSHCHALSPSAQARLLRVLLEGRFQRDGSGRVLENTARIVAATSRPLLVVAHSGEFREDLAYRLSTVVAHVPPLRERGEDLMLLVGHLLAREAARHTRKLSLSPRAEKLIRAYAWPGNVAQLESVLTRCAELCEGDTVVESDLPEEVRKPAAGKESGLTGDMETIERERLVHALEVHGWNQTHAARFLCIGRTALQYKMNKYGLRKP